MTTKPTIRSVRLEDAAQIQAIYAPVVEHTAISFEEQAPTVEEMAERISSTTATHPYLVAVAGNQVMGYAYASAHRARASYRWSVDVSVYVAETARGMGLGKELYQDLLAELSERRFHAAFAGITLPNAASVALHESVGFTPVGIYHEVGFKFGRWHDVGWWQRILD